MCGDCFQNFLQMFLKIFPNIPSISPRKIENLFSISSINILFPSGDYDAKCLGANAIISEKGHEDCLVFKRWKNDNIFRPCKYNLSKALLLFYQNFSKMVPLIFIPEILREPLVSFSYVLHEIYPNVIRNFRRSKHPKSFQITYLKISLNTNLLPFLTSNNFFNTTKILKILIYYFRNFS